MASTAGSLAAGTHFTTINNLKHQYTILTSDPTLPVVLVNPSPWGIGATSYIKWFSRLSDRYTVLIPSPRGNDASDRPPTADEMSSRYIVSDVEALRIHLNIDKFHAVVGHSAGGVVAIGYAILHPSRVERLITISSDLRGYQRKDMSFFSDLTTLAGTFPTTDEEMQTFLLKVLPLYFAFPDQGGPEKMAKDMEGGGLPRIWCQNAYYGADAKEGWKQIDELVKIEARTLVFVGREDRCCAPEISEVIARGIKRSVMWVEDACGHMAWIERPDSFWPRVESFLAEKAGVQE